MAFTRRNSEPPTRALALFTIVAFCVSMPAAVEAEPLHLPPLASLFGELRSDTYDTVYLRDKSQVRGELMVPEVTIAMACGTLKMPLRKCAGLSFDESSSRTVTLVTANSNRFSGSLTEPIVRIRTDTTSDSTGIPCERIRWILLKKSPEETTFFDASQPTDLFVIDGGDMLTGVPAEPALVIRTQLGDEPVTFTEMAKAEFPSPETGQDIATLLNSDVTIGKLKSTSLVLKLDLGVQLQVPTARLSRIHCGDGNLLAFAGFGIAVPSFWNVSSGEVITNSIGMRMRMIYPGTFDMGSQTGKPDEKPRHSVHISRPFYLGIHEVTQEQYEKVMGRNPSSFIGLKLPVDSVSFEEAQDFCKRLSMMEQVKYRLPTESEWEYACRAGTSTEYHWGERFDGRYAWCDHNGGKKTHEVGTRVPNQWGLYDMTGNVYEWCQDWYAEKYPEGHQTDPQGPAESRWHPVRGGCWIFNPQDCRSANRIGAPPQAKDNWKGFRVVRELPRP